LDCARQRLGLVAVDPPEKSENGIVPKRTTIKSLQGALNNSETTLLD